MADLGDGNIEPAFLANCPCLLPFREIMPEPVIDGDRSRPNFGPLPALRSVMRAL